MTDLSFQLLTFLPITYLQAYILLRVVPCGIMLALLYFTWATGSFK